MEMFKVKAGGLNIVHIPYRGSAQTVPALLAGDVEMVFQALPSIAPFVAEGKLRILGVAMPERSPVAPEVPTLAEAGVPVEFPVPLALLAAKGTPTEVVNRLSSEIAKVAKDPQIVEQFRKLAIVTHGTTPKEAVSFIEADTKRVSQAAADAGIERHTQ
jgi:tripartite-type tricarboxylate transporter receptor subunit TctC